MKLYLGGGRNPDGGPEALTEARRLVQEMFAREQTKQVLHIPFARIGITHKNRAGFFAQEFAQYCATLGIGYLNATFYEDIALFEGDTIYINGGGSCEFLLQMCKNEKLAEAIAKARVVIGESCGAMILCEYLRDDLTKKSYIPGLGYIPDTIIEPHYTEHNKQERLNLGMTVNNVKFGLGIDEATFVEYQDGQYGVKIGGGKVVHR